MGDVACPKRRDMFDRLRRRIELYKRRHSSACGWGRQPETTSSSWTTSSSNGGFGEGRREEIQMLQQKWQETKVKRAAAAAAATSKGEKSSPRVDNLCQQPEPECGDSKLKRKLNVGSDANCLPPDLGCSSSSSSRGGCGGGSYDYDGNFQQPPTKSSRPNEAVNSSAIGGNSENQLHSSVSVNIVHNIDASLNQTQGEIKLTFSSTLNARPGHVSTGNPSGSSCDAGQSYDDVSDISANPPHSNRSSQNSHSDSLGLDDLDELSEFLDHIGGQDDDDEIPTDILKDLDQGLREFEVGLGGGGCDAKNAMSFKHCTIKDNHPGIHLENLGKTYKTNPLPGIYADPLYSSTRTVGPVFAGARGQGAAPMAPFVVSPRDACAMTSVLPAPPLMGDTGPAAETLKQMAAQHQNQENAQYGLADIPPQFGRGDYCGGYSRATLGCIRPYPTHGGYGALGGPKLHHGYPYGSHINGYHQPGPDGSMMPGPMATKGSGKIDPTVYRMTRPLSHYPEPMSPMPSSLQKLQNQVQSHFGSSSAQHQPQPQPQHPPPSQSPYLHPIIDPSCRLEMSQSQQLQLQQHGHHFCMSNSQQMTITAGAGGGGGPSVVLPPSGAPPHISMTQQQSFSMRMPNHHHQHHQHQQQHQQATRMPPSQQPASSQMYPPDIGMGATGGGGGYDAHHQKRAQRYGTWLPPQNVVVGHPPSVGMTTNGGRHHPGAGGNGCHVGATNNPLQTMRKMVDQQDLMESDLYTAGGGGRAIGSANGMEGTGGGGGGDPGVSSVPYTYFQASQQQMMSVSSTLPPGAMNGYNGGHSGHPYSGGVPGPYTGNVPPYDHGGGGVIYRGDQGHVHQQQRPHGGGWSSASSQHAEPPVSSDPTASGCQYDGGGGGGPMKHGTGAPGYPMHAAVQTTGSQMALVQQQQLSSGGGGGGGGIPSSQGMAPLGNRSAAVNAYSRGVGGGGGKGGGLGGGTSSSSSSSVNSADPTGGQMAPASSSNAPSNGFVQHYSTTASASAVSDVTDCMSLDLSDGALDCGGGVDYFGCPVGVGVGVGQGQGMQNDLSFIEEIFSK